MRLKLNKTLRAALIAAITAVGFTLPQSFAEQITLPDASDFTWVKGSNAPKIGTHEISAASVTGFAGAIPSGTDKVGWFGGTGQGYNQSDYNDILINEGGSFVFKSRPALGGEYVAMGVDLLDGATSVTLTFDVNKKCGYSVWIYDGSNSSATQVQSFSAFSGSSSVNETWDVAGMTGDTLFVVWGANPASAEGGNTQITVSSITLSMSAAVKTTQTWAGKEGSSNWSDAAWDTGVNFTEGNDAVFDSTAESHTVGITSATKAGIVTVSDTYEFNLNGGSLTASTMSIAADETLSITGEGTVTLSGALTKAGTLSLESDVSMTAGSSSADAEGKFALEGGGHLTLGSLNMGSGAAQTLAVSDGSTLTVGGTVSVGSGKTLSIEGEGLVDLTTLKAAGGTINVTAGLQVTGGGNGKGGNNGNGLAITGDNGTVNINGGTTTVTGAVYTGNANNISLNVGTGETDAKLLTRRLEIGDRNGGSATFHIGEHGTVVITGDEDYRQDVSNPQKNTSLQLAEWSQVVDINIEGNLYAKDATAFMSNDASSSIAVNGGTMAVKGIATNNSTSDRAHTLTMTDGKIVLGERGIAAEPGAWTVTFNSGEIGMYSDATVVGRNANITGDVTFNTAKYVWSDNQTLAEGEEGGTMTVSANLTGTGTITKTGAGELILSGTGNALTHTLQVNEGKITISGSIAIDDIEDGELEEGFVDASDVKTDHGNGFAYKSGMMNVYHLEEGAELVNNGSFTLNGVAVDVTSEGKYELSETVDKTTLYVNQGSADFSAYKAKAVDTLTKVALANGTTVNMDSDAVSIALAIAGTGTVNATKAATVTTLTGTGKLIVGGSETVSLQTISGYTGEYEVGTGATLQIVNANLPGTLTVAGSGDVRLLTHATGTNVNLTTVSATNLHLYRDDSHNSRFVYKDGSNIAGVSNLYFDGAQLWLDGKDMTGENAFGGNVTFNATTYSESGQPVLNQAAMRINNSAAFNGTVTVQENTKLAFATDGTVLTFGGALTGSGQLELRSWNSKTGTFRISDDASDYEGAILSDSRITLDVANGAALTINSGSDIKGAVTLGTGSSLTVTGEGDSSISGIISGDGGITKDGEGTLTLSGENTYTGDTVVNGGTLNIAGSISEQSTVKVAEDATLTGNTDDIKLGIEAGKTATIVDSWGFTPKETELTFFSESGEVQVQNTGDAEITYGIDKVDAKVVADGLMSGVLGDTPVVVENAVFVKSIAQGGTGALTLTHVDADTLEGVYAYDGVLTLQNTTAVSLTEMSIAPEATVAVYQGTEDVAAQEGTVTITDTLTAGGGTLLANLTIVGNEQGTTTWTLLGQHMTLGSEFTMDTTKSLVNLDITTLRALDNLELGESLVLVKALDETALTYGDVYDGTWFGQMFNREGISDHEQYSLVGDFQVFSTADGFGLTKVSATPEPTTGTLSLLALAALAARRRKH